jgi:phage protein D
MAGILRHPTAQVVAGGSPMPFDDFTVTQTRTKHGDTFTAKSALSAINLDWWLSTTPIPIVITINGTQVFTGNVDHADADFTTQDFSISGRDKAAATIDAQSSEKFLNQMPAQIVQTIAGRHGLQTSVDNPGGDAGKIYSADFDAISHGGSEWSLINKLAEHYGMIAYFTGGVLYFKNYDEQLPSYQINYTPPTPESYASGNFIKLKAARNLILGRPIKVNIRSHNHRQKKVISSSMTSSAGQGPSLVYNHTIAGITQDQADRIAKAKLAEAQAHELTIDELEIPGDETVNARMSFVLSGTGTLLDQSYDAQSIEHRFSVKDGYRTGIHVKNKKGGS